MARATLRRIHRIYMQTLTVGLRMVSAYVAIKGDPKLCTILRGEQAASTTLT